MNTPEMKPEIIAQTDNFVAWRVDEPDGETTFHLDINNLTIHFFLEEWEEFLQFRDAFMKAEAGKLGTLAETDTYFLSCDKVESGEFAYNMEIIGATIYFFDEDWAEFKELVGGIS